jgi:primary-amine oxidase
MICIFESYAGDIAWRHAECPITDLKVTEVRPKVTLVVRMAAAVANYDYIMDWEFQTDGLIRSKVGLSGILMVKGTTYDHMNQVPDQEYLYGTLLSENIIGVIHDHFITYYLDMDIDGSDNSFVKVNIKKHQTSPGESPRKSYLKAVRKVAKTEKDAQIKLKLYDPSEFHVVNPLKKTRVGNPVGYKLVPGATAASLLDHDDPPQKKEQLLQIIKYGSLLITRLSNGLVVYLFTRAKAMTLYKFGPTGIVRLRIRTLCYGTQ